MIILNSYADAESADCVARQVLESVRRLLDEFPEPNRDGGVELRRAQFDAGLAWVHFPIGRGGLGLPPEYQAVVDRELARAGVVDVRLENNIGHGNAAPILVRYGTDAQCNRFLRPCFTNEEVWCQLMSEPGAGSDIAGLATRAQRDGDVWLVNGQKVWTTLAHTARWGLLVARHAPEVPKHAGLTCFVVDMREPGVEVRPLRQMTGRAEFNEVFLSDVRVPDEHRVGDVGAGWAVVMSTLQSERMFTLAVDDEANACDDLLEAWNRAGRPSSRQRDVVNAWIAVRVNELIALRAGAVSSGGAPGPDAAVIKVRVSESTQAAAELAVDLSGAEGMLYPSGYDLGRPRSVSGADLDLHQRCLNARGGTIAAGTSQIMRNVLGERVLGLPREPRVDLGIPWRDVPREGRST